MAGDGMKKNGSVIYVKPEVPPPPPLFFELASVNFSLITTPRNQRFLAPLTKIYLIVPAICGAGGRVSIGGQ